MEQTGNTLLNNARNPWWWIPTLYFVEGIPYVIVNNISVILFKKMGLGNADVALYTSLLYLPWVIKPLWSPIVGIADVDTVGLAVSDDLIAVAVVSVGCDQLGLKPCPDMPRCCLLAPW